MPAILDFIADTLSGLNVRLGNYLYPEETLAPEPQCWCHARNRACECGEGFQSQRAWIVQIWDDGLDYDMDGNSYWDDYPGEHPFSYHDSEKGAEVEAAWLIAAGLEPDRLRIEYGWTEEWCNKPIQSLS